MFVRTLALTSFLGLLWSCWTRWIGFGGRSCYPHTRHIVGVLQEPAFVSPCGVNPVIMWHVPDIAIRCPLRKVMQDSSNLSSRRPGPIQQATTSLTLLERVKQREAEGWHRLVSLYQPLV